MDEGKDDEDNVFNIMGNLTSKKYHHLIDCVVRFYQ